MKKDTRKVMALMLLAAMTASMTAGCSGKSGETTSTTAAAQAAGTEAATESGLEGSLISAEPKEFTIFDNFNNMPFDSNWQMAGGTETYQHRFKGYDRSDQLQRG